MGQENGFDVTNPHTGKIFFKFEKSSRCGGLVQIRPLKHKPEGLEVNVRGGK